MKRILPILVVGVLVLSGLGAVALDSDLKEFENDIIEKENGDKESRDYTHTVLVEYGSRKGCSSCPATVSAWKNLYAGGNYDFEYVALIYQQNPKAQQRFYSFNPKYVPTTYFDGGQYTVVGTNTGQFTNYLNSAGSRSVPDLVGTVNANWLGDAKIDISISVENNDNNDYPGTLRVYVVELVSRWTDYYDNPYGHALLDFPWQQSIDIDAGDTFEDNKVWDGAAAGYSDIEPDNLQVILSVFDDTANTGYSDPPSGNPFNAYYADETVATLINQNPPPNEPTITGPTTGDPGVEYEYTFTSVDPEDEDIYLFIDWGGETQGWLGSYESGEEVIIPHTFDEAGIYEVKAKAKDINDNEGDWSDTMIVAIGDVAPSDPLIYGRSTGTVGKSYKYTFDSEDPNDLDIYYFIKWGDGETEEWIGPYESGKEIELDHTWTTKGDYTIEAQVKNTYDVQSGWSSHDVSMPRGKITQSTLFMRILERFPHTFPVLRSILGL